MSWAERDQASRTMMEAFDLPGIGSVELAAGESGSALLDECALGFARIFGLAQGATEGFLCGIGAFEIHSLERAYAPERGLDGEGGVARDLIRCAERTVQQFARRDQLIE